MKIIYVTSALVFISFVLINSQSTYTKCPIFTCSGDEETETTCMIVTEVDSTQKNYTFTECAEDGYICPFNPETDYDVGATLSCQIKDTVHTEKIPGQGCSSNSECITGNCDGDICKGKEAGSSCISHDYCEEETYCHKENTEDAAGTCKTQIYDHTTYCNDDYECANEFVCYNNVCETPYSLLDGETTTNIKMCRSNYGVATANFLITGLYTCDSYYINESSYECADDQDTCEYTLNYSGTTINLDCLCSMTETEKRRCPADYTEDFMNDWAYNYITVDKAHTLLRDYSNWEMKHYKREWPNKDMLECVEKSIGADYLTTQLIMILSVFIFVL